MLRRLAALAVLLALSSVSRAEGPTATFVPPEGGSIVVRSLVEPGGRVVLAVADVATPLGGVVGFDEESRSFDLKVKQHAAFFGTETPIVVVDTRLVTLAAAVHGEGPTPYADAEFFQKVLAPMVGLTFTWDKATHTLASHRVETQDIFVEAAVADFEATSKVVLRFTQAPTFKVEKSEEQLVLRFPNGRLMTSTPEKVVDDPRVARILIRGSEIALVLKEKGLATNVYTLTAPARVVVDVTRPAPTVPTPRPGETQAPAALRAPALPEPKTIVLDPGHGGTEDGAKGPGGLLEKEATLALVRAMKETLAKRGYRVITTRDSDATVGLDDRAANANAAKADVFLSIHCNASRSAQAHGTEVYYLSLDASDRAAAAVAEMENRKAAEGDPANPNPTPSAEANASLREVDIILWDLAQNQHLAASARLAEGIQADFNRLLGITTRGVKQAPFKVLIGVNAPAVLVEVAFITNADEEKKLASEEFRKQAAETLADSLESFFKSGDRVAPVPYPSSGNGR